MSNETPNHGKVLLWLPVLIAAIAVGVSLVTTTLAVERGRYLTKVEKLQEDFGKFQLEQVRVNGEILRAVDHVSTMFEAHTKERPQ